jgi:hypothetical protein
VNLLAGEADVGGGWFGNILNTDCSDSRHAPVLRRSTKRRRNTA